MTHAIISELIPTSKNLNFIEIDFNELEKYGKRKTRTEFIDISDKIIGNKKLNEWFEVNGISLWWFVFPTIYPICNDAGYFQRFTPDERGFQSETHKTPSQTQYKERSTMLQEQSDLKELYLSRDELQQRIDPITLTQDQLFSKLAK